MIPTPAEAAAAVREKLLGPGVRPPGPRANEPVNGADLRAILSRPFADSWARDGLDLRTKSYATMSMLIALGAQDELSTHFGAALRVGITPEEITELLIHSAGYCGVVRTNAAYATFSEVLRARDDAADAGG
jgi:alkylhydroperoxidase/carboxymuconolactone decarboxylase family protein YurZ